MTIYLDLDGTLLDTAPRYHALHQTLLRTMGGSPLCFSSYWAAKRDAVSERQLGERCGLTSVRSQEYAHHWTAGIEDAALLRLDRPFVGALDALDRLHSAHRLVLVSLRQRRQSLLEQLGWLGLRDRLDLVLSAEPRGASPLVKAELLRTDPSFMAENSAMVGDSELDIHGGAALGIRTYAVLSGIRAAALLAPCRPTHIVQSIQDVVLLLPSAVL